MTTPALTAESDLPSTSEGRLLREKGREAE